MGYRGKVQGGVIVLEGDVALPEGTEVTVVPCKIRNHQGVTPPTIWEKMTELAQWAETQPCALPEDLASNHDHYLHGLPKRA